MVKRLISSLTAKIGWRLLGKTFIGFLALLLAGLLKFSFFGVLVFLGVAAWLYFSEGVERTRRRAYFFLLTLWAWVAGAATTGFIFYIVALVYASLIYAWLGELRLLWSNREIIKGLEETGLFAASAVLVFNLWPGAATFSFWGDIGFLLALFFFAVILLRSAFDSAPEHFARRERLAAWGGGLIITEIAAILVFLPLGFINAAAVLTLIFIVLRDTLIAFFRGHLKTGLIFREITILTIFLILIFAIVPWSLT